MKIRYPAWARLYADGRIEGALFPDYPEWIALPLLVNAAHVRLVRKRGAR